MLPSANCVAIAKERESLRISPYQDIGGVPTIGYGHTGPDVSMSSSDISEAEATQMILNDLTAAGGHVNALVKVPLTQNQYDALCLCVMNVGGGALGGSTLLKVLNLQNYDHAAAEFTGFESGGWIEAAGKPVEGLLERRLVEQTLFRKPR